MSRSLLAAALLAFATGAAAEYPVQLMFESTNSIAQHVATR